MGVPRCRTDGALSHHPPPQPSPNISAFTRVFDALWGEGAHRACDEVCESIRQEYALVAPDAIGDIGALFAYRDVMECQLIDFEIERFHDRCPMLNVSSKRLTELFRTGVRGSFWIAPPLLQVRRNK